VWGKLGRRVVLYLLTLQILLGAALLGWGLRVPTPHVVLAVAAWFGYMGANRLTGQPEQGKNVLVLCVLSTLMLFLAVYLGLRGAGVV
jgi:hypothetical protein